MIGGAARRQLNETCSSLMSLLLRVVNQPANSTTMPPSAWFDMSGGMIGRAKSAHLSLEDPDRMVSRFHAHVSFADGSFFIEDMGSTNPALVNDRVLTVGQRLPLSDGDRIRIGAYTIAAEIQAVIQATPAANGTSVDAVPDSATPGEDLTLLEAFKIGARLDGDLGGVPPSMMQSAGASLRQFADGARRLLALRPPLQADAHSPTTLLRGRTNPLKAVADDAEALAALLHRPKPGYLPGPVAVEEVMRELEQHMRASQAATQIAMNQLLGEYSPEIIEQQLSNQGVLGSLVPSARKAKLWDLYVESRATFDADLFERLWADAYVSELARLRGEGEPAS
jgi:predicted component of type VI protein secretion system